MKELITIAINDLESATTQIKIPIVFLDNESKSTSHIEIEGSQKRSRRSLITTKLQG